MKKSTKLYLQGLIEFFGIPCGYMGVLALISNLFGSPFESASNFFFLITIMILSAICIIYLYKGFKTLEKAKYIYDIENHNPLLVRTFAIYEDESGKSFWQRIKKSSVCRGFLFLICAFLVLLINSYIQGIDDPVLLNLINILTPLTSALLVIFTIRKI